MKIDYRQLFPLGKAYGQAFCNRKKETLDLVGNIQSGKHTLLIAPRRYGKSSLAERAIEKAQYPFVKINFHLCTSTQEVTETILTHVIQLMGKSIGKIDKMMTSIKQYLSNLEPLLSFGGDRVKLQLTPKRKTNPLEVISESLLLIEKLLREKKKKAILFLDEFQEIDHISQHRGIEGAIRTAAQEMQQLSIIFSGSIRSLLLSMFEDENRPLYKLCRKIKLDRISTGDYKNHIQKIAQMTWGEPLEEDVFEKMMTLSNRHPYYVNYLCDVIWADCKNFPTIKMVEDAWGKVVIEEWSDALRELSDLPIGQRRLLKYIATHTPKNLTSHEVCQQLFMPASSINAANQALMMKDYIEKNLDNTYQVINPLLCTVLKGTGD